MSQLNPPEISTPAASASATTIAALSAWLASPPGRYVQAWEQETFAVAVADVFGFNALQLGLPSVDGLRNSRMPLIMYAGHVAVPAAHGTPTRMLTAQVLTDYAELPFANQSLDLVVLPHILEFCADPHQLLREVERVLIPEGRVVISGFNPLSLWGLRQRLGACCGRLFLPQSGNFISLPRLKDWLKLLSFDIERGWFGCYRPPCRSETWLARYDFMEPLGRRWWGYCGAVYMLVGVKRVRAMRLVGPVWQERLARARAAATATQRNRQ